MDEGFENGERTFIRHAPRIDSEWDETESMTEDLILHDRSVVPHIYLLNSHSRYLSPA